jgi:hypothetical protein
MTPRCGSHARTTTSAQCSTRLSIASHSWWSDRTSGRSDRAQNRGWRSNGKPRRSDRPQNRSWWSDRTSGRSLLYPLHYSCRPQAVLEPPALPLHQQSPPVKAVSMAPLVNPHPMTTWVKQGLRLPTDRLTLLATSMSTLSPVPSSIIAALVDLNWSHTMEEEFATLITNNT